MKTYSVNYSNEAVKDLLNIYDYITNDLLEPTNAINIINEIREHIRSLNQMPFRHPLVPWSPWDKIGMRHFSTKKQIVFYLVDEKNSKVVIVRILSCKRDIPRILKG